MAETVDHFATLGLERSAALDETVVRERFHELSREAHPDAENGDEAKFAAINEAQRVLSSPAARLRHLLELEYDGKVESSGAMSAQLMDLFSDVGGVLSQADALISKRQAATTAVAKALLAGEEVSVQQALMGAGGQLMGRRQEIEDGLGGLSLSDRDKLVTTAHELAFLEKWQRQVQERLGQLI